MAKKKKGSVNLLIESFLRILFAIVALLAFVLLVGLYIVNKADTKYLQAEVFKYRILYSDNIMYQDPTTFRIYEGIVDMNKLNKDLDDRIDYKEFPRHIAAKIKLLEKPNKDFEQGAFLKEAYYNKDHFLNMQKLIDAGINGKESGTMYISSVPATCRYNENDYRYCTLIVEVIVPNS